MMSLEETLVLARIMLYLTPLLFFVSVGIWYYIFKWAKKKEQA